MRRRTALPALVAIAALPALPALAAVAGAAARTKVLRYAFPVAETSFDPAQIVDLYSRSVTPHIFEALYGYDHLARPAKIVPLTAAGAPEVDDDYRSWTVRVQPGIFFQDDPAFGGRKRELVAEDYVYALKRFADPQWKSPVWTFWETFDLLELKALRDEALAGKPFDYDRPIAGVQALDRYTLRLRLAEPRPRFLEALAGSDIYGAVAREVVEHYGAEVAAHPVGTGPFRLAQWRRSSFIALERNPGYRERTFDAEPGADDADGQALLARFRGRRLPMIDRVEISIIEEAQPRWLTFLQQRHDLIQIVPPEYIDLAMPGGELAPNLARQGVQGYRTLRSDIYYIVFNMQDPVVGGMAPAQVAMRRAIGLAMDVPREIAIVWHGQAVPAQSPLLPGTSAWDPGFKSEAGDYDPARAKALLDLYGYVDRDGDGWRERPDGSPLTLTMSTGTDSLARKLDELRQKNLAAVGIRIGFEQAKWPEQLKAARAGNFQLWRVGSSAAGLDSQPALARYHSKQVGGQNLSRFDLPAFDAIYDRMLVLPDGPERDALYQQAIKLALVYAPYKLLLHRIVTDLAQPWLAGYRRPVCWQDWWHMVDIDAEAQQAAAQ